jgi:hypothetical protein
MILLEFTSIVNITLTKLGYANVSNKYAYGQSMSISLNEILFYSGRPKEIAQEAVTTTTTPPPSPPPEKKLKKERCSNYGI